jgi:RimJ/RimL family protein N-acetyltransferase
VPYDRRFLDKSWLWLHDAEVRRLTMTPFFTRAMQEHWFAGLADREDYRIWGAEVDGEPIGAFGIKNIEDGAGEYWGYIGEKRYWGRGIGGWMLATAEQHARDLGLRHLWLRVEPENERAIRLYRRHGFVASSCGSVMTRELA